MTRTDVVAEDYMILKFKGDLLYYKGMYEHALKIYKDILSSLPPTHGQVCVLTNCTIVIGTGTERTS